VFSRILLTLTCLLVFWNVGTAARSGIADPGSNVVDVYIFYLRRKLGTDLIETVRGMGYRLKV